MTRFIEKTAATLRARPRETGLATAGAVAIALVFSVFAFRHTSRDVPSAAVRAGRFFETLVETGTVSAQRLMLYSSTIPGVQAKILELAREGSSVRAGDILVRFDASAFEQTRARDQAALSQAEADLVRAREELRLQLLSVEGDLETARQQVGFAEAGLQNQVEGRGRLQIAEADGAAAEAARELARAKKSYDDLKPMLAQGFITKTELDRAEQAWQHADEQKRIADARRDALTRYEQPAATGRAQADVHAAREALVRETETASARANQRRAAVVAAESRVREIGLRIAMLDDQIARTVVRASGTGLVVYRDLFFGNDRRKPQVGDEVWPNQPIIALPDSSQLVVDTRIREIDLHKIATSQRVEVHVDAYPDLKLPASVALVGALAQEDATRASTKFFPVTISLLDTDARLRTGMTARVQIEVQAIPSTLIVPVQAVFDEHGETAVYVLRSGSWDRRLVKVTASNELEAAVSGPIADGDRVALINPGLPAPSRP